MGRPLGAAGDSERQRDVLALALETLDRAAGGGTIVDFPERFRPG